ncbi:MAG: cache domain-containing protein, partial [Desulfobacterales bacterium]
LAIMLIVPLLPFILLIIIGYHYFTDSIESQTISKINRIVEDHQHIIDVFLSERKSDLQFVMDSYVYTELTEPLILQMAFDNLQRKSNAFVDIGVFDKDGTHVAYIGPFELVGKNYKDTKWFQEVSEKGYYISDIFLGYRQMPHFVIAIAKSDGGEGWIIRATIDSRVFNDLVEKIRIGKTGEAYLVNKSGHFQTERRSGGALMAKDPDAGKYQSAQGQIKTFIQNGEGGEPFLYATTWLKNKDWLLIVRQEKSDAFQALHSVANVTILIAVLGGVLINVGGLRP